MFSFLSYIVSLLSFSSLLLELDLQYLDKKNKTGRGAVLEKEILINHFSKHQYLTKSLPFLQNIGKNRQKQLAVLYIREGTCWWSSADGFRSPTMVKSRELCLVVSPPVSGLIMVARNKKSSQLQLAQGRASKRENFLTVTQ